MKEINLFEVVSEYYQQLVREGINRSRSNIRDGVMYIDGRPVIAGKENKQANQKNLFMLANGSDLTDFLVEAGVIKSRKGIRPTNVKSKGELIRYLDNAAEDDGAVVYDRTSVNVRRVGILRDGNLEDVLAEEVLPDDYLAENGSVPLSDEDNSPNVGGKTTMALKASRGFKDRKNEHRKVDAYLISQTPPNQLGFGKMVMFSEDGMEVIYVKHEPEHKGKFFDEDLKIVLFRKSYSMEDGKYVLRKTSYV